MELIAVAPKLLRAALPLFARLLVISALSIMGPGLVGATVITIDFEDLSGTVHYSNYQSQGFRFSPNCHWDTLPGVPGGALGWDKSGCEPPSPAAPPDYVSSNPDWLGPASLAYGLRGAWMYIDFAGIDFSLIETDLIVGDDRTFLSSKGGEVSTPSAGGPTHLRFDGAEWRNVSWLLISGGSGEPYGIDNLMLDVPAPSVLSLLLLGLLAQCFCRLGRRGTRPVGRGVPPPSLSD